MKTNYAILKKNTLYFCLIYFALLLFSGCRQQEDTIATPIVAENTPAVETVADAATAVSPSTSSLPQAQEEGIFISELLPGILGNNNAEFIELYNAGSLPVDLAGWSLWYRLSDSQDELLVYDWNEHIDIPGHGHYLLLREEQSFDIVADALFSTPLFERRGGLVLRDADGNVVDRFGWGDGAAAGFVDGTAVFDLYQHPIVRAISIDEFIICGRPTWHVVVCGERANDLIGVQIE